MPSRLYSKGETAEDFYLIESVLLVLSEKGHPFVK